jgi:hypothetical protein
MRNVRGAANILLLMATAGCWSSTPEPAPLKPVEPPPAAPDAGPAEANISLVTSMVIVDACPDARHLDTKLATREIEELVGPCKKVPGGGAHFAATLLPDGRVELAAPSGDVADGVVPTCLLQKQTQLKHKLHIKTACKFDVRLEQRDAGQP